MSETWAILASGPSMSQEIADAVKGIPAIAVSNTYELAPWAEVLVSNDRTWWVNNPKAMEFAGEKFCGLVIEAPKGVEKFSGAMSGSNSALLAMQVAVSKGAKRILLFGVDLAGSHYFGDHPAPLKNPTQHRFDVFQKQFAGFRPKDVEILNCSPESLLRAYPFADAKDFLPQPVPEEKDLDLVIEEAVASAVAAAVAELPKPKNGKDGDDGEDGGKGDTGPMGPMPDHQWDGTRLRFEEPDGTWGKYVDLKGAPGQSVGGGGGGGLSKLQALQLQTLLDIFGGWIATPPLVAIASLTADDLEVSGIATATGFYPGFPGGLPVDAQYEWDWGDGATSSTLEAVHTYAEPGTYLVSFRAKNHIGWSEPVQQEIEVTDAPPVDPFWEDVVLLLQGDALEDASGRHELVVSDGDVAVDNDMLVFDGASALRIDDNLADFQFGGSWTVEGQLIGVTAGASTAILVSNLTSNAGEWQIFTRGAAESFRGGFYAPAGAYVEPGTPPWVTDALVDWGVTYDAGTTTLRLYINGAKIGEAVGAGDYSPDVAPSLFIGRESAIVTKFLRGSLRLRITNGVARMTADTYTPPTWPVPTN